MISVLKIWVFYNANCRAKAPLHICGDLSCVTVGHLELMKSLLLNIGPRHDRGAWYQKGNLKCLYITRTNSQAYDFTSYNSSLKSKEVAWPCMPAENAEAGRVTCHLWHDQQRSCTIYSFTSTSFTAPGTWSVFASSGADASWPAEEGSWVLFLHKKKRFISVYAFWYKPTSATTQTKKVLCTLTPAIDNNLWEAT